MIRARTWHSNPDIDYRPECSICLDAGDSCIACDRLHAAAEPIERAVSAWLAERNEVTA